MGWSSGPAWEVVRLGGAGAEGGLGQREPLEVTTARFALGSLGWVRKQVTAGWEVWEAWVRPRGQEPGMARPQRVRLLCPSATVWWGTPGRGTRTQVSGRQQKPELGATWGLRKGEAGAQAWAPSFISIPGGVCMCLHPRQVPWQGARRLHSGSCDGQQGWLDRHLLAAEEPKGCKSLGRRAGWDGKPSVFRGSCGFCRAVPVFVTR